MELNANIPSGPIEKKWDKHRFEMKLVNPANKRKYSVIVVGTGLAGGAGAASMAELGYNVKVFCYQDSARRAHSIAAQGGINAAKNYRNDGDSVERLRAQLAERFILSRPEIADHQVSRDGTQKWLTRFGPGIEGAAVTVRR